jgi:energy-coupling factor transporter ATP-binding protein EcfA2
MNPMAKLPAEIFRQHIAVLGKTGSGKSSVLRSMVEGLLDDQKPVCIIDPKGDWWGLKLSASGKSAGYPVVIFGGEYADVPLNAHSGQQVAELIATGNRPCIINLGGWMPGERTRFFVDFASTLFRTTRGHRYIVIDEVHNFAPQGKVLDPDAGKMLHWANRLASEGRGKGLTILSASQRPQKVHKDFLTCAETLVAMRVIHKLDRDAIKDWIDGAGDAQKGRDVLNTLASMQRGEGWVWSPEIGFGPKQITFPLFKTYDSFAPQANSGTEKLKGWASVDLSEIRAKLASVVEEAKANDPKELRKQIAEWKKKAESKEPAAVDPNVLIKAAEKAAADCDKHWQGEVSKLQKAHSGVVTRLKKIAELAHLNGEAIVTVSAPTEKIAIATPSGRTSSRRETVKPAAPIASVVGDDDIILLKSERAILRAFYWLKDETATPSKVSFYSGYASNSSTWNNALGRLRRRHLSGWTITPLGIAEVESWGVEPKPSGKTLREWLRARLGKAENIMLDALCEAHPSRMTTAELSESSGYSSGSSTWNNAIGRLRGLEAAEGYERDGGTKAADVFFE